MRSQFSVVSLFTGAAGLDVGLEKTGRFDLRACVEVNPTFCATLETNRASGRFAHDETLLLQEDIRDLDARVLREKLDLEQGELDVLVGGPPCQAFSTAGRRQSIQDPRGMLIWDFMRFVEEFRPKYFLMENVRGLLSAALRHRPIAMRPERGGAPLEDDEQPGSVVDMWVEDLLKTTGGEYRVDCFEVNAVNYGAPQLRERILFFGNRLGEIVEFPAPTHGPLKPATGKVEDDRLPFRTLRDVLDGFEEVEEERVLLDFSPRKKGYLSQVPPGGNWRSLPDEVQRESMGKAYFAKGGRSGWWRRLGWDFPCPTIVTMPNHASTSMCHPNEVRVLSVAECARIQEFPTNWIFEGTPQEQYEQVGNAVPARLGEVSGSVLTAHLSGEAADRPYPKQLMLMAPPPFRRVYLDSHVRTRRWFKQGEAIVAGRDPRSAVAYSSD